MRIVKITRIEYTLENGSVLPIDPPLPEDMTIEEFQKYYDFAAQVINGCGDVGSDDANTA